MRMKILAYNASVESQKEKGGPDISEIKCLGADITEAINGVLFKGPNGQRLKVCEREGGFEVQYNDGKIIEFKE